MSGEQKKSFWQENKKFILVCSAIFICGCVWVFISESDNANASARIATQDRNTREPVNSTDPKYASEIRAYNIARAEVASTAGVSSFDILTAQQSSAPEDPFMVQEEKIASEPAQVNSAPPPAPLPVVIERTIIKEVAVSPDTKYDWKKDPTLIAFFSGQAKTNIGTQTVENGQGVIVKNIAYEAKQQALLQQAQQAQQQAQQDNNQASLEASVVVKRNGDLAPATLITEVNTTRPSMVRARIEGGELAGAIVTGVVQRADTSVTLQFNNIIVPGISRSIPIQAVAMDLKTASTALATSVNRHIPERLFMAFASSFGRSYAGVLKDNNTTSHSTTIVDSKTGNVSKVESSNVEKKSTGEINREAGANALGEAINVANSMLPTVPTVKVRANHEIAIYFTADFAIPNTLLEQAKDSRLNSLMSK